MKKVPTVSGDYLIYFHPLKTVSNIFMRNGTYSLMLIDKRDKRLKSQKEGSFIECSIVYK